jgi:hypothetical protein
MDYKVLFALAVLVIIILGFALRNQSSLCAKMGGDFCENPHP